VNRTRVHRRLKWLWVAAIPVSVWLRSSVLWVVVMSHYAIIASHWAAEEAADDEESPAP
jgi:hypothetical protein